MATNPGQDPQPSMAPKLRTVASDVSRRWLRRWLAVAVGQPRRDVARAEAEAEARAEAVAEAVARQDLATSGPAAGSAASLLEAARYELKFVAAEIAYHDLVAWLQQHKEAFYRPYPRRQINNVYFDRFDFDCYEDSISGTSAREKVRYRWYGDAELPQPGQLEIKLRRNRFGWKRNFPVTSLSGTATTWNDMKREILEGLPRDARWWLHEYGCPILINRYERDYWVSRRNGIRATVDRHLRVYDQRYSGRINTSRRVDVSREIVLEVKGPSGSAEVLSEIVTKLPLPLTRHSKYCNALDLLRGL